MTTDNSSYILRFRRIVEQKPASIRVENHAGEVYEIPHRVMESLYRDKGIMVIEGWWAHDAAIRSGLPCPRP